MNSLSKVGAIAGSILFLSSSSISLAGGSHDSSHNHQPKVHTLQTEFGRYDPDMHPTITIKIGMSDQMRFTPALINVKKGEVVEFHHTNHGKLMHEFVLGTSSSLDHHAKMMKKNPSMPHDKPYMVHVAPGDTGKNIWQFSEAGQFSFACLIPGHYEAGMRGTVIVGP